MIIEFIIQVAINIAMPILTLAAVIEIFKWMDRNYYK